VAPLRWIAVGLALVLLDFRTESLDLLADPVGWAAVGFGAWRLADVGTTRLAGVAAVLSLGDAALPYSYVPIDPLTGEPVTRTDPASIGLPEHLRFEPVSGWRLAAMTLAVVVGGATVWSLLRGLERRARGQGELRTAGRLRLARWLVVATWVVPYLVGVGLAVTDSGRFDPIWNGDAEYVALVGLLVVAYVIGVLVAESSARWAQPHPPWTPTPWDAIRLRRAEEDESGP
jgi:hypothetical protein